MIPLTLIDAVLDSLIATKVSEFINWFLLHERSHSIAPNVTGVKNRRSPSLSFDLAQSNHNDDFVISMVLMRGVA
ncbi:MAG: hypothetical protein CL428_00300 [Acidimicrobiaceae bacterium]|nr:hypothetical protein [Acidimicrobiaceae bacterium]